MLIGHTSCSESNVWLHHGLLPGQSRPRSNQSRSYKFFCLHLILLYPIHLQQVLDRSSLLSICGYSFLAVAKCAGWISERSQCLAASSIPPIDRGAPRSYNGFWSSMALVAEDRSYCWGLVGSCLVLACWFMLLVCKSYALVMGNILYAPSYCYSVA